MLYDFQNDVVSRLGDIANRVPRPMTELAHDVYDAATKMSLTDVDVLLLNECFRTRYPAVVKEATDLCADLSGETMTLLKALCRLSDSAVALEIVQNAFPGAPDLHHQLMAEGAGKILDSLCQSSVILRKTDQKYDIVDSFRRYALKLSLGVA